MSVAERFDPFTLAGIAAVETTAATQVLLRVAVEPIYEAMFRDFGGTLPVFTRLFIEPWGMAGIAAALSVAAAGTLLVPSRPARLLLLAILFGLGTLGVAAFFGAMYLPIFSLAPALQ